MLNADFCGEGALLEQSISATIPQQTPKNQSSNPNKCLVKGSDGFACPVAQPHSVRLPQSSALRKPVLPEQAWQHTGDRQQFTHLSAQDKLTQALQVVERLGYSGNSTIQILAAIQRGDINRNPEHLCKPSLGVL